MLVFIQKAGYVLDTGERSERHGLVQTTSLSKGKRRSLVLRGDLSSLHLLKSTSSSLLTFPVHLSATG